MPRSPTSTGRRRRLLDVLAAQEQPDFVNIYGHQPDSVQHDRWKWFEPERFVRVDPADVERWGDDIPARYRAIDRFLAALIERLDPGTTLMVVSDHGHSPTLIDRLYSQHRHGPPGIVLLWGDSVRPRSRAERRRRVRRRHPPCSICSATRWAPTCRARCCAKRSTPESAAAAAPRTIESYDAFGAARFTGSAGPDLTADEIERLRALGYL